MDMDTPEVKAYLYELNTMTQSDPDVQVSMHDVGAALGFDKDSAGQLAEILFMGGYAELKTLAGGIGITPMGMETLGLKAKLPHGSLTLGTDPVLAGPGREVVETILAEIKTHLASGQGSYDGLEEVVLDIKTIEVQMLSPRPKTSVVREVLRSIHMSQATEGAQDLWDRLGSLVNS